MTVRRFVRNIPGLRRAYRSAYDVMLRMRSEESVFTNIYRKNKWFGTDSVSGLGSDSTQTRVIARAIPEILRTYDIQTMHDIPCGDFFWMKDVELGDVDYLGSDIVNDLVEANRRQYRGPRIAFSKGNLLEGTLRQVDLMFVRDCLVHFSNRNIQVALQNICDSGSKYLLTTTFPARTQNHDIPTGRWRPINLELEPFCLPPPLLLVNEGCTEAKGVFADKSLGLWFVDDIRTRMR